MYARILFLTLILFATAYAFFGDFSTPEKKIIVKSSSILNTSEEEAQSFNYLNSLREHAGMSTFFHNENLKVSASSHADYLIYHDIIGHYQEKGKAGFTGVLPKNRIIHAGYKTGISIENVSSHTLGYKKSIEGLFSAIYHRFGFLDFQVDEIGIGVRQDKKDSSKTAYVYNMGVYEINDLCTKISYTGKGDYNYHICADENFRIKKSVFDEGYNACYKRNKKVVIYPYDEQDEVPPAFYDELPDPLPEHLVSGFPISIQFNPYYFKVVKLKRFELFLEGKKVEIAEMYDHISDINSLFKRNEFAIFPQERLSWDSRYHVEVVYEVVGKEYKKEWDFTTQKLSSTPIMIDKKKMQVEISATKGTILYFKPKDQNDILEDVQYATELDVAFIDKNTIMIRTKNEVGEIFKLHVSGRDITLVVSP